MLDKEEVDHLLSRLRRHPEILKPIQDLLDATEATGKKANGLKHAERKFPERFDRAFNENFFWKPNKDKEETLWDKSSFIND